MVAVVARRGRELQRYTSNGRRLVVGSVPPTPIPDLPIHPSFLCLCLRVLGSPFSWMVGEPTKLDSLASGLCPREGVQRGFSIFDLVPPPSSTRFALGGRRNLEHGCIPYKFKADSPSKDAVDQALEVLVISSQKGQDILFPKGGWESDESIQEAARREAMEEAGVQGTVERILGKWRYKSKAQDTYKLGYMFPLNVTEEMLHWPEMESRKRRWVTVAEARETCQQPWMRKALDKLVKRLSDSTESNRAPPRVTPLQPCNNNSQ
ncbi:hypothetical protein Taro_026863 [Colocasia esculenta]|uniref:Nudix hydrolase domain-containing protein n=1 Tax=Colocasia esculenta TaxID=4460 RepID=A0A843VGE7_COLES|nr:hypothetical protein [Colocasia esculenta]